MSSISEHIESDDAKKSSLWWLKSTVRTVKAQNPQINITTATAKDADKNITSLNKQIELDISSSLDEFLEKDPIYSTARTDDASDADIGSIIDEINKLASQSPIGHYENSATDKSVEEILQEAEKIYLESSKSFEQLSSKSRTSLDISLSKSSSASFKSKKSTPSPKSNYSFGKISRESKKLNAIVDHGEPAPGPANTSVFDNEKFMAAGQNDNDPVELNNNDNDDEPNNLYEDEEFDFESISEKDDDMNFNKYDQGIDKIFDQKYFETHLDNIRNAEKLSLEKLIPSKSASIENETVTDDDKEQKIQITSYNVPKVASADLVVDAPENDQLEEELIQDMHISPDPEEDIEELRREIEQLKVHANCPFMCLKRFLWNLITRNLFLDLSRLYNKIFRGTSF